MKLNYNKNTKDFADKKILSSGDIHNKLKEIFNKDFPIEEDSDGNIEIDFGSTAVKNANKSILLAWLQSRS